MGEVVGGFFFGVVGFAADGGGCPLHNHTETGHNLYLLKLT